MERQKKAAKTAKGESMSHRELYTVWKDASSYAGKWKVQMFRHIETFRTKREALAFAAPFRAKMVTENQEV